MSDITKSAIAENSEVVIDKFAKYFLNSDVANIIGDFPMISTAKGIASGIYSIINWRIARNIRYFIKGLQNDDFQQEDYDKLAKKYGRDKILENVLLSLESMRSEKQALAFSCLFDALIRGDIAWKRYSELQNILEKIDPDALDDDFIEGQPSYKLVAVGLGYVKTVYDGVKVLPNGKLYTDFEQYIVRPYREKAEREKIESTEVS